jgi:hypothetical protein
VVIHSIKRALVESIEGGSYYHLRQGKALFVFVPINIPGTKSTEFKQYPDEERIFEGWKYEQIAN